MRKSLFCLLLMTGCANVGQDCNFDELVYPEEMTWDHVDMDKMMPTERATHMMYSKPHEVQAVVEFERGAELLDIKNYSAAARHLKRAVELDPKPSKYHTSLGIALLHLGKVDQAWEQSRLGVLGKESSRLAVKLCNKIFDSYQIENGQTEEEIVKLLGNPDQTEERDNKKVLTYGNIELTFNDLILIDISI